LGRPQEARKEFEEALQIYEALVKQDPERFSADVTRVEKLLAELPLMAVKAFDIRGSIILTG
jgi:hypothetical protein